MFKMPDRRKDERAKQDAGGETDSWLTLQTDDLPPQQAAERDSEESFQKRRDALKEAFEALK